MPTTEEHKLDNPVYFSLQETHKPYCIGYAALKCYDPRYCPFGAFASNLSVAQEMSEYTRLTDSFYIVGHKPEHNKDVVLKKELVCLQMILRRNVDQILSEKIVLLNDLYEAELFTLVNLVQPGYFNRQTSRLGAYYGIFRDDVLVAAAGERMKTNRFTEISAVVTHPDHTGKGYAKQLIAHAVQEVRSQGRIAYLHVAETNAAAINLYQTLGFQTRRKISFWHFVSKKIER